MASMWKIGPNACMCDPVAPVDDCASIGMCEAFQGFVIFIFLILLIASIKSITTLFPLRDSLKRSLSRVVLLVIVFVVALSRVLHGGALLTEYQRKYFEDKYTWLVVFNYMLLFGGAALLSGLTIIVYLWYKTFCIVRGKMKKFGKQKIFLVVLNLCMWAAMGIFFNNENVFNGIVGGCILIISLSFLIQGTRLYRDAYKSGIMSSKNKKALSKITQLVNGVVITSLLYLGSLAFFHFFTPRFASLYVIIRHTVYRFAEYVLGWLLVLTFKQSDSKESGVDSQAEAVSFSARESMETQKLLVPSREYPHLFPPKEDGPHLLQPRREGQLP